MATDYFDRKHEAKMARLEAEGLCLTCEGTGRRFVFREGIARGWHECVMCGGSGNAPDPNDPVFQVAEPGDSLAVLQSKAVNNLAWAEKQIKGAKP